MKNLLLKIFRVVPALSLAGTLSGCATMFCGTEDEIEIASFPQGASLYANGEYVGRTPVKLDMNRDSHPLIVLKKDGYADTRVQIKDEWNGTTMLNTFFLPFAPVGWILDTRSGATREYTENYIVVPVLTKDSLQNVYYKGNVKVSNLNPSKEMKALENAIRETLILEIEKYIEPLWVFVRDAHGKIAGRHRATGTAWTDVTISDDGTILDFEATRHEGASEVNNGARKIFQKMKSKFVLPEELRSVCPLTLSVPVKYKD